MRVLLLMLAFVGLFTSAQNKIEAEYLKDELIIQLNRTTNIEDVLAEFDFYPIYLKKVLSNDMKIFLLGFSKPFNRSSQSDKNILSLMRSYKGVITAQFNHIVSNRSVPDDSLFVEQWSLENTGQDGGLIGADIQAIDAWEYNTTGITKDGDSVVVSVVDNGFHTQHPDIHFWINSYEIPDDSIDNDNNGYIDDIYGWNAFDNNADINQPIDNHGTHVAGIMGAKGNNGIGITGISWGQKVMVVSRRESTDEAVIISAYSYILKQRQIYNETQGDSGAFVVSLNSSFGVDNGQPEDFPIWCAMYDSMGDAGIINVAATVNSNTNVDDVGDIPTTCPSPFLICVTRSNQLGEKTARAGWGPLSIDLAAPGSKIMSTLGNNSYGFMSGTSMACPHVTGAIGFLYANASSDQLSQKYNQPDSLANLVIQAVFAGVDFDSSLLNKTTTEGKLNLYKSTLFLKGDTIIDSMAEIIPNKFIVYPNPTSEFILFAHSECISEIRIYDITGKIQFQKSYTNITYRDKITINTLANGFYFIKIVDELGNNYTQKWQKL